MDNSVLAFDTVSLDHCQAEEGGGMFATQAALAATHLDASHNAARSRGGGAMQLQQCRGYTPGGGPAMATSDQGADLPVTVANSRFEGNSAGAPGGGAIGVSQTSVTLANCWLAGNSASAVPASYHAAATSWPVPAMLVPTALQAESPTQGGAVLVQDAEALVVENGTVIVANAAPARGGGVTALRVGSVIIRRGCTLAGNRAGTNGGGVWVESATSVEVWGGVVIANNSAANMGGGLGTQRITERVALHSHVVKHSKRVALFARLSPFHPRTLAPALRQSVATTLAQPVVASPLWPALSSPSTTTSQWPTTALRVARPLRQQGTPPPKLPLPLQLPPAHSPCLQLAVEGFTWLNPPPCSWTPTPQS